MSKLLSLFAVPLLTCAAFAAAPAARDVCADPRPKKDELASVLRAQAAAKQFDLITELSRGAASGRKTISLVVGEDGSLHKKISVSAGNMEGAATDEDVATALEPVCQRRAAVAQAAAADAQRRAEYDRQNKAYEEAEKRYRASQSRQEGARRRMGQVSGGEAPASPEAPPAPTPAPAEDKCAKVCAGWAGGCNEAPTADNCRPLRNIGRANNCSCVD